MRLETEAREGRKGLWADSQPVPSWVSGGSEKESDDASQGTAQRVQDAITGQVLRRMDRHKRATNYPNLSGAGQCEFATMVTR